MKIGHVRFNVRDVEASVAFYGGLLGMTLNERIGDDYAFLSGSDAHHEVALWKVKGTRPSLPPDSVGFEHVAFELPDKRAFARAFLRLSESGVGVDLVDNGISWAMYFADPDGNRIELYADTRQATGGRLQWEGRAQTLTAEAVRRALES
jgi:catechol 2,3-dioxygenase